MSGRGQPALGGPLEQLAGRVDALEREYSEQVAVLQHRIDDLEGELERREHLLDSVSRAVYAFRDEIQREPNISELLTIGLSYWHDQRFTLDGQPVPAGQELKADDNPGYTKIHTRKRQQSKEERLARQRQVDSYQRERAKERDESRKSLQGGFY